MIKPIDVFREGIGPIIKENRDTIFKDYKTMPFRDILLTIVDNGKLKDCIANIPMYKMRLALKSLLSERLMHRDLKDKVIEALKSHFEDCQQEQAYFNRAIACEILLKNIDELKL